MHWQQRLLTTSLAMLLVSPALRPEFTNAQSRSAQPIRRFLEVPPIPFKQFTALSQAKEVRMKLGNTEFKLKKKHLEVLRGMLKNVNS
jgi:hypothetical protein